MRWRILALLAAALVLLEGCDGRSGAQPAPTPTTATSPASVRPSTAATRAPTVAPSVPPDVPRTGPNLVRRGEQPPVMPVLATEHTTAGAIAFAKFFIQTIDWGFATTSGAYVRHYFQPSCTGCESLSSGLNQAQQAGHRYVGGRLTVRTAKALSSKSDSVAANVTFAVTSFVELDSKGKFITADIAHNEERFQLTTTWSGGAWSIRSLEALQ